MSASSLFSIDELIRPNIRNLKPYRSARDDFSEGVLLDANENSLGSVVESEHELNRYPDPLQDKLREAWADLRGIDKHQVFLGVGSDEPIDLLIRMTCRPGDDNIIITPPTYGMYKVAADINNVEVKECRLDEQFQPVPDHIRESADANSRLLFLCSPNNPTGNLLKPESIRKILDTFQGLVIIDEAYVDFSSSASWCDELKNYPNLVVLQTLSKAFGMAGIRLGAAFAGKEIINYMLRMKAPYNINKLTANAGLKALSNTAIMQNFVSKLVDERRRITEALQKSSLVTAIRPSDANFILAHFKNAKSVYQKLAGRGVIIRYRGDQPGCENGLRITVGTPEENDLLLSQLNELSHENLD